MARSCLHASRMCLWSISFGMSRPRVPVSQWRFTISVVIHTLERREVCRDECKTYGADTHFILCMLMWSIGMWCARMTGFVDFWSTSWVVHSTFTVIINMSSLTCLFERSDVICVPCASACASTHNLSLRVFWVLACQDLARVGGIIISRVQSELIPLVLKSQLCMIIKPNQMFRVTSEESDYFNFLSTWLTGRIPDLQKPMTQELPEKDVCIERVMLKGFSS